MIRCATLFLLVACVNCALSAAAENGDQRLSWPDKQGPSFDGHVAAADSVQLPVEWNEEAGKNIALKIPLEGLGHSTPVIGRGRLWLTSASADGTRQWVYCIDEATGKILHEKLLFENEHPEPLGNAVNTYASPSCALDPDAVYVHFGTYGTAKLNPETAEVVWKRRDIECRHFRGPGSSPVICGDLLILTFDGIDQQFVMALNKQTGETVWRTDRTTNYDDLDQDGKPRGEGDYRKAYSTPTLVQVDGRMQVLSPGSKAAFGYDALTGKEIWTLTYGTMNAACRPLIVGNAAIVNTGSGRAKLMRIRLDASTQGDITKSHVEWDREKGNSDMSSPILVNDEIYMIAGNGVATCVDAATGKEIAKSRIKGTFVASPIFANGLIYFTNEEGTTTVVRAGTEFEEASVNQISDGVRASPAASHGAIWIRGYQHLYKIAETK